MDQQVLVVKRKKAKKKWDMCDCDEVDDDMADYVGTPDYKTSGWILKDGSFAIMPIQKEFGEGSMTHQEMIGDRCRYESYIQECDAIRVRIRCDVSEVRGEEIEHCRYIVSSNKKPTSEQLETLIDVFDHNKHWEIALYGKMYSPQTDYSDKCSYTKYTSDEPYVPPRKLDFQKWYSNCWGQIMKRKARKKWIRGHCDCDSISDHFKKFGNPEADSGFILPDGKFTGLPDEDYIHNEFIGEAYGSGDNWRDMSTCYIDEYLQECGSMYLRLSLGGTMYVDVVPRPTKEQVDTLKEHYNPMRHETLNLFGGKCTFVGEEGIKLTSPRPMDYQRWLNKCW